MDVLADLLDRSHARGAAFAHTSVHGDWDLGLPAGAGLAVHAMVAGGGYLCLVGEEPVALAPGDVVLVRGTRVHGLARTPRTSFLPLDELMAHGAVAGASRRYETGDGKGDHHGAFFCGAYLFAGDLCAELLASLPDVLHVQPAAGGTLRAALDLLAREIERDEPGQQTVLDRLLDVVLVQLLREHLGRSGDAAPAWHRAGAGDREVADALALLHTDPTRAWTVAELAAAVNLSRAAFARRFSAAVGTAPLEYLTGWRMALARERLRDTDEHLAAVAAAVGYASEFSFAAAFKRAHGVAPGRWRTQARARTAADTAGGGGASATARG